MSINVDAIVELTKASTLERACMAAAKACADQYSSMAQLNTLGAGEYWSQRAKFQRSEYLYHLAKAEALESKGL